MKKLSKAQIIALVVIAIVIFVGFGVVNLVEINKKSKGDKKSAETAKMPDPGAKARKKYKQTKEKEDTESKPSGLIDNELPPIEAGASKSKSKKSKAKENVVSEDSKGDISGILPSGSILTEAPVDAPPAPEISVPKDDVGRKVVDTPVTRINTSNVAPGIPTGLLDQTPPESGQRSQQALIPPQMKIRPGRYLFNNLTDGSLRSPAVKFQSGGPSYSLDNFAPQGEFIDVVFMHNAATNQQEVPIMVAVWTPFYFQGHRILNTGDKLLGRAQQGKRGRLMATFDKVVLKSGKSVSINALALDIDGTAGIEGYIVGDRLVQQIGLIASEALGDFLEKLNDRATENQNQVVYFSALANNQQEVSGDLKTAIGSAMKKATQKIQETLKEETEEQKPYVLVPAGTRARAYLLTPFDSSVADYGK